MLERMTVALLGEGKSTEHSGSMVSDNNVNVQTVIKGYHF
jgi:hypothetical protein